MKRVGSALLGLVAVAGLVIGSVGIWARTAVFDTSEFTETANRTYADPEVQAALADFVTAQAMSLVDVDKLVRDAIPDRFGRLDRLGPMIAGGLEFKVHSQVESMLATDRAAQTVDLAARNAHTAIMRVLAGGNLVGGVSLQDDTVRLNLLPLITRALDGVQDLGVLGSLDVPEFDRHGDPTEQIEQLSQALNVDLSADFGQVVIYRGERVESAQTTVATAQRLIVVAKRGLWVAIALMLVAGAGSVLLAGSRLKAILYLSLAAGVVLAVLRSTVPVVIDQAGQLVSDPRARTALQSALSNLTSGLVPFLGVLIVASAAVALVSLVLQRFAPRQLAAALCAVAVAVVVGVSGFSGMTLIAGVAMGLLVSLAASVILNPN